MNSSCERPLSRRIAGIWQLAPIPDMPIAAILAAWNWICERRLSLESVFEQISKLAEIARQMRRSRFSR